MAISQAGPLAFVWQDNKKVLAISKQADKIVRLFFAPHLWRIVQNQILW
jgi:hypothetical protein